MKRSHGNALGCVVAVLAAALIGRLTGQSEQRIHLPERHLPPNSLSIHGLRLGMSQREARAVLQRQGQLENARFFQKDHLPSNATEREKEEWKAWQGLAVCGEPVNMISNGSQLESLGEIVVGRGDWILFEELLTALGPLEVDAIFYPGVSLWCPPHPQERATLGMQFSDLILRLTLPDNPSPGLHGEFKVDDPRSQARPGRWLQVATITLWDTRRSKP